MVALWDRIGCFIAHPLSIKSIKIYLKIWNIFYPLWNFVLFYYNVTKIKDKESNLLVHICCSVDSHYFLQRMQEEHPEEKIVGYFYDPNIHPYSEYRLRYLDVEFSCKKLGIGKDKLRKLLEKGEGTNWDKHTRNKRGGGYLYDPFSKFSSLRPIYIPENSKTSPNMESGNDWDAETEQFLNEVESIWSIFKLH